MEFAAEPSMQLQVLKALCSGQRKKASDLLLDFGSRTQSLTADDFLHIFKFCARSPDPVVCYFLNNQFFISGFLILKFHFFIPLPLFILSFCKINMLKFALSISL